MIQNIKAYVTRGNTYFGVEISVHGTEYKYATIGLEKSKKKLNLSYQNIEVNIKRLAKTIGKIKPVFITINTSDVLTKQVRSISKEDHTLVNEAFPNLKIGEFYFQIHQQQDIAFVSICRKDIVHKILKTFQDEKIFVIDFGLGVLSISNALKFFDDADEIITSRYKIELQKQQIKAIEKYSSDQSEVYDVNGLQISSAYILGFSGALSLVIENNMLSNNYQEEQSELDKEFKNQRMYKLGIGFSIVALFATLLINFIFFNHYFSEVNELREVSQFMNSSNKKVTDLNAKVMTSKKMILDVQSTADSKASFYINAILQKLPSTINLKKLNFQPLQKRVETAKPIIINRGELVISGNSMDASRYSTWLAQLEALEWINKVDIISYESVSDNKSEFSIKVQINEKV
ncbi:PilN domain-containing protein [uncultured Winogradskyella sp.]|uniref:PilN domain-containing protein n=1 Tax=uncultured Winogradskyella sp. TaxID=395353 RepID=UPI0026260C46|nr:PilN domain-containing protein [uncultured Winogradskyella sp.]